MDLLLVGTFPDGADLCHVSTNINGPDLVANSRIAISYDKISTRSRSPILRVPILRILLTRVHPGFTAMIPPRVSENHRVSILLSSNIPTLLRDFSSTHEDLSPAQLLSTRTVDGYSTGILRLTIFSSLNSCAVSKGFKHRARSPDLAVARVRFPSRTDPAVLTPSV
jgi:hypothetical protein